MVDLRMEYPRPLLVREKWLCLNGQWQFEIDSAEVGIHKEYWNRPAFDGEITVPYCPESKLSGIGCTDFMDCVWYRRTFTLTDDFKGKRTILHFGAVDYHATVWVNGQKIGEHKGGYTPFSFDITNSLTDGENVLVVQAVDHLRQRKQPCGKQTWKQIHSADFTYTRVTGIWQTVWLEPVEPSHIISYRTYPNVAAGTVTLQVTATSAIGKKLTVKASYQGRTMGEASAQCNGNSISVTIMLAEKHLWEIGNGRLYDLEFSLGEDRAMGYFGLREIGLNEKGMTLNGKTFFGRWVLDQGYYPDGLYTAPSDAALKKDIEDAMALGFNGARLHLKVFEPRFLYWADKLGYTVWGEHAASSGLKRGEFECLSAFLPGWMEQIERDFSHPSVIGWIPFNETWDDYETGARRNDAVIELVYRTTKAMDITRPCIDASGAIHVMTDIHDEHEYEQDPVLFAEYFSEWNKGIVKGGIVRNSRYTKRFRNMGGPLYVSEYGGIGYNVDETGWSYGRTVGSEEEFVERYKGLTDALLDNENIMGFCYTQLYDIEQEQNGLLTYKREFKFQPEIIYDINTRKAKIEMSDEIE